MIDSIDHISFIQQQSQKYRFDKRNQAKVFDNNIVVKVPNPNMSQVLFSINNISFRQSCNTNSNINTMMPVNKKNDDFLFETKYSFEAENLKDLYDTNFEQTLNEIKEYSNELIKEDDDLDEFEKQKRINITNSINIKDIKFYIKKYLLDEKPEIKDIRRNND